MSDGVDGVEGLLSFGIDKTAGAELLRFMYLRSKIFMSEDVFTSCQDRGN